jgi:redox-sensitive bicupin YhaK (pirin superfamily)
VHSEINPLDDQTTHLLQIWIEPEARGLNPGYQEANLKLEPGIVVPVASRGGRAGGLDIHQDVTITAALLGAGDEILQPLSPGRHLWMQVVAGSGTALGLDLEAGDGLAVANETAVVLRSDTGMEVLTFDLA